MQELYLSVQKSGHLLASSIFNSVAQKWRELQLAVFLQLARTRELSWAACPLSLSCA